MATCSRCGKPIEFRYINGACIPLHLAGNCIGSGNDYSGYNTSPDSTCYCTSCPECGREVYFIRHNGGSVWIDPPLGAPWYKHGCFDSNPTPHSKKDLVAEYSLKLEIAEQDHESNLVIGIVKSTSVDILKRFTKIIFETGKQETLNIKLQHNAGFLLGKICLYDTIEAKICPIDEPSYTFAEYTYDPSITPDGMVACPKCNAKLNPKNLNKHLKRQHGVTLQDGM